jgi:KaiC/GvpD/RAD55 family RecA-like ATPase
MEVLWRLGDPSGCCVDGRQQFVFGPLERVKTGVCGLDDLLSGGFPRNIVVLVSGPPGSGKTILCYQFLFQGLEDGDRCLFLSVNKKIEGVLSQARDLGLDFEPAVESGRVNFLFLNTGRKLVYETFADEVLSGGYDRVVLDSITPLLEVPVYVESLDLADKLGIVGSDMFFSEGGSPVVRFHLDFIMNILSSANCTSLVTSELPMGVAGLSRDGFCEFLVDGVIVLGFDPVMDRRKLSVVKMMGTRHTLRPQDVEIGVGGLRII